MAAACHVPTECDPELVQTALLSLYKHMEILEIVWSRFLDLGLESLVWPLGWHWRRRDLCSLALEIEKASGNDLSFVLNAQFCLFFWISMMVWSTLQYIFCWMQKALNFSEVNLCQLMSISTFCCGCLGLAFQLAPGRGVYRRSHPFQGALTWPQKCLRDGALFILGPFLEIHEANWSKKKWHFLWNIWNPLKSSLRLTSMWIFEAWGRVGFHQPCTEPTSHCTSHVKIFQGNAKSLDVGQVLLRSRRLERHILNIEKLLDRRTVEEEGSNHGE